MSESPAQASAGNLASRVQTLEDKVRMLQDLSHSIMRALPGFESRAATIETHEAKIDRAILDDAGSIARIERRLREQGGNIEQIFRRLDAAPAPPPVVPSRPWWRRLF